VTSEDKKHTNSEKTPQTKYKESPAQRYNWKGEESVVYSLSKKVKIKWPGEKWAMIAQLLGRKRKSVNTGVRAGRTAKKELTPRHQSPSSRQEEGGTARNWTDPVPKEPIKTEKGKNRRAGSIEERKTTEGGEK